jgi:hypothetical protein
MSEPARQLEDVLDKLVRNVEAGVHAMYRGDVRQQTLQSKSETYRRAARDELLPLIGEAPARGSGETPAASQGSALEADEVAAITRCIMGWMPMGPPTTASPQSRCVSAAKELAPAWGEREKARLAMKRIAT